MTGLGKQRSGSTSSPTASPAAPSAEPAAATDPDASPCDAAHDHCLEADNWFALSFTQGQGPDQPIDAYPAKWIQSAGDLPWLWGYRCDCTVGGYGVRAVPATRENVAVKISGLAMFDHRWTVESLRPYVLETIDAFGTARAMFASNFPVDRLFGSYTDLWNAYAAIVEDASVEEKDALFRRNAERIYRI